MNGGTGPGHGTGSVDRRGRDGREVCWCPSRPHPDCRPDRILMHVSDTGHPRARVVTERRPAPGAATFSGNGCIHGAAPLRKVCMEQGRSRIGPPCPANQGDVG